MMVIAAAGIEMVRVMGVVVVSSITVMRMALSSWWWLLVVMQRRIFGVCKGLWEG